MYGREGRSIFAAMGIIFLIGLGVCFWSESQGNPALQEIGVSQSMGSMEGKEVRFGIAQSAMFTTTTTSFTTGTVNNMHDTLTPLGGMIPLLHMMLNVVFGGKGVGLMNMIMYAILAVFICGLMIGRTPEYLGKKIEGREMKLTALCIIIHPFLILSFSALAIALVNVLPDNNGLTNPGFHGLSQVLYEYSSSAANNGSGFEGLYHVLEYYGRTRYVLWTLPVYCDPARYRRIADEEALCQRVCGHPAYRYRFLRCDPGICGIHFRSIDILPSAGSWPHCGTSHPLGIRRNL